MRGYSLAITKKEIPPRKFIKVQNRICPRLQPRQRFGTSARMCKRGAMLDCQVYKVRPSRTNGPDLQNVIRGGKHREEPRDASFGERFVYKRRFVQSRLRTRNV